MKDRRAGSIYIVLGAMFVALLTLLAVGCGGSSTADSPEATLPPAAATPTEQAHSDQDPTQVPATEEPTADPTTVDPMDGPSGELPTSIQVEARDNFFDVETIQAPANTEISVRLTNEGVLPHNITFLEEEGGAVLADNASGPIILEAESASVTFTTPDAGTYFFYCTVHPLEMTGEFIVK